LWWHLFFFAQPDKPERAILADPEAWYDRAADDADRAAGSRISCPTLVAWSAHDDMEALYGAP
jgi:haloacetate dehalogenase